MPVFFARRERDDVACANFLDRFALPMGLTKSRIDKKGRADSSV